MEFDHDELVLINEALLYYKRILQKNPPVKFTESNVNTDRESHILLNQLLEKLTIELCEEAENIICDDCHSLICENGDIFIDNYSFRVDRPMVVCCNCYDSKYSVLCKD